MNNVAPDQIPKTYTPSDFTLAYLVSTKKSRTIRKLASISSLIFLAVCGACLVASVIVKILLVAIAFPFATLSLTFCYKAFSFTRYKLALHPDAIEYYGLGQHWTVRRAHIETCTITTQSMVPRGTDTAIVIGKTLVVTTNDMGQTELRCPLLFAPDLPFVSWFAGIAGNVEDEYRQFIRDAEPDPATGLTPEQESNMSRRRLVALSWQTLALCLVLFLAGFTAKWYLMPSVDDFRHTYTLEGKFDYVRGSKHSLSYLHIDGKSVPLECGPYILGSQWACGTPKLRNRDVLVELANFRTLFGSSATVVAISTLDGAVAYVRSPEQLVQGFNDNSTFQIYLVGSLFGLFYFLLMLQFRFKPVRHFQYD